MLEEYNEFIADKLLSFPDTSTTQMYDWLKKAYAFFPDACPKCRLGGESRVEYPEGVNHRT